MTKAKLTQKRKLPMPLRILVARPRLLVSILVCLFVVAMLPMYSEQFRGVTRVMAGWDVGVALYLVLAFGWLPTATWRRFTGNLWLRMKAVSPSWC